MTTPTQQNGTAQVSQAPANKPVNPVVAVRDLLVQRQGQFAMALPRHIPAERFVRMAVTAVQQNPELALADRQSLMNSCMRAAQDGLVTDGREAALVIYKTKVKKGNEDIWVPKVQYMPMVAGILKKARNSGDIASISAHVVHEKDRFLYVLGDDERIEHAPFLEGERGPARAVYAIAKLKDGSVQREVMSVAEVERIRSRSKSKDHGPWVTDWSEMARKTVIRRIAKYLPASTDKETGESIVDIVSRDDELFDHGAAEAEPNTPSADAPKAATKPRAKKGGAAAAINGDAQQGQQLAPAAEQSQAQQTLDVDPETGEIREGDAAEQPADPI